MFLISKALMDRTELELRAEAARRRRRRVLADLEPAFAHDPNLEAALRAVPEEVARRLREVIRTPRPTVL